MPAPEAVNKALQAYTNDLRSADEARSKLAEKERAEILTRFPISAWPDLTLEQYAIGQEDSLNTFGRWLEFRSQHLGSIQGGSAHKHIVYKHLSKPGWHFDPDFVDERAAWEALRVGFVTALDYAKGGRWNDIDGIVALHSGAALTLKTLYVYYPDGLLPIYSRAHLRDFVHLFTGAEPPAGAGPVQLNRYLLETVRSVPGLEKMSTLQIQYFLYRFLDPRSTALMVKVAPGHDAEFWDDCRAGGYICIGWDEIGDLSAFESKDEFRAAFEKVYAAKYKGHGPTIAKKANEVWMFRELEIGDLVLANRGTSQVLGLGRVVEPAYQWDNSRTSYKSTVRVDWDVSFARAIPPQSTWPFVTVAKVADGLRDLVLSKAPPAGPIGKMPPTPPPTPVTPLFGEIAAALTRKKQVVLYGPPGTGKTYHARRFAVWWLKQQDDHTTAGTILGNPESFAAAEREFSGSITRRVWWVVASPEQWSWSNLAKQETVTFRFGRLKRNYAVVQPGDLVIGYESTPAKRVVALARVVRLVDQGSDDGPKIELRGIANVRNGPAYDELRVNAVLGQSEPMRFRNQGTLFALTDAEATEILALVAAADPDVALPELDEEGVGRLTRVTFHPSYSYEDFIEGYRPVASS